VGDSEFEPVPEVDDRGAQRDRADERGPREAPERDVCGARDVADEAVGHDRDQPRGQQRRPPAALDDRRALVEPLLPREPQQQRPRGAAPDRIGGERGHGPACEHERQRDPEAVDEAGGGVDELGRERHDGVDEHQAEQHKRAGRAEVAQLAPQLAGVAADDGRDRLAQRRDQRHERSERQDSEEGEPDAASVIHPRSVGTVPQRNVNVS